MGQARVVVTGDVHIDHTRHSRLRPGDGRPSSWESSWRVWQWICQQAVELEADAVVLAGDAYVNGWPRPEAGEMLADGARLLSAAKVPLVVFDGNHEYINRPYGHRSPLERLADIEHVRVVREPDVVVIGDGLQIACLPWPRRTMLVDPASADGLSPDEVDELVAGRAAELVEQLAGRVDPGRGPAMLAAHATVGDAVVGSDRRGSELSLAQLFCEPTLALADVELDAFQHVALAHIHRRQQLGERTWYVGSPDRLDFSDAGVEKAASLVSIDDDGSPGAVTALATPARRFAVVTVPDGASAADVPGLLGELLAGAVVRAELPAGADQRLAVEIRRSLDAAGAASVVLATPPAVRHGDRPVLSDELTPLDGLRMWLTANGYDGQDADRLMARAAELLG